MNNRYSIGDIVYFMENNSIKRGMVANVYSYNEGIHYNITVTHILDGFIHSCNAYFWKELMPGVSREIPQDYDSLVGSLEELEQWVIRHVARVLSVINTLKLEESN